MTEHTEITEHTEKKTVGSVDWADTTPQSTTDETKRNGKLPRILPALRLEAPVTCVGRRRALSGKPDAGNPHVRFDEGRGGASSSPTRLSLRGCFSLS